MMRRMQTPSLLLSTWSPRASTSAYAPLARGGQLQTMMCDGRRFLHIILCRLSKCGAISRVFGGASILRAMAWPGIQFQCRPCSNLDADIFPNS
jgi:hypothetical protein